MTDRVVQNTRNEIIYMQRPHTAHRHQLHRSRFQHLLSTIRRCFFLPGSRVTQCAHMKLSALCLLQVARGLVLPFTTLLSYIFLASKPTPPLLAAIGIVCVGFMVGVSSEKMSSVSYIGIILGVCSSVTTAGHAIVVKRSLPVVNGSAMDLAYYSNFLSAFIMAPAAVLAETGAVVTLFSEGGKTFRTFWVGGLVTVSPCIRY